MKVASHNDAELQYSKAYERFVEADDDTVGMLAYALYKSSVRQEAMQGAAPVIRSRAPVPALIDVYRQAAEQRISEMIARALAQATPDIQASAAIDAINTAQKASIVAIESAERNVKTHVDSKTGFWQAVVTSFVGWLLTLGVTAIIIFAAGRPSVEDRVKRAVTAQENSVTSGNSSD